jgi:hypothetical protein
MSTSKLLPVLGSKFGATTFRIMTLGRVTLIEKILRVRTLTRVDLSEVFMRILL